jgi:16S rRNA (uracil1498-N3)-methyltransferase
VRLTRVHCDAPLEGGREVVLPESAAQHVAKVLRLRAGDPLVLFDGRGRDHEAEIVSIVQGRVTARVLERRAGVAASPLAITLVQGVSRAERMDLTLQKATELGVHAIAPVLTARGVVRLDGEQAVRKLRHWRSIVVSACEQSGRSVVPEVRPCATLSSFLAEPAQAGTRILLDPAGAHSLASLADPGASLELLIGPEGGLDESERAAAREAGFQSVRVGPRILRTETAGLAALAILQAAWGDLR